MSYLFTVAHTSSILLKVMTVKIGPEDSRDYFVAFIKTFSENLEDYV